MRSLWYTESNGNLEREAEWVKPVLAVDIGASSGRHILGWMEDGKLQLKEMYRFENKLVTKNGHLCWDADALFESIVEGMRVCGEAGMIPESVGIDTWAVDFALLDAQGQRIGDTVAYRDSRTQGMDGVLDGFVSPQAHYARAGIQKQIFNTVYQLLAVKAAGDELDRASRLLMMPEYFHYLLTGECVSEYTNASSTALLNAKARTWDWDLIDAIGVPRGIFGALHQPGTTVGMLREEIARRVGYNCRVVLPATHDTASAVLAAPVKRGSIYISSGTWSLMGVELTAPVLTEESRARNLTNEGGVNGTIRYLKNIMGLWIIQNIRNELGRKYSFPELAQLARAAEGYEAVVDVNDARFLAPESMIDTLKAVIAENGYPAPRNLGELMQCVYTSLALCYREAAQEIAQITGETYDTICIVGGGCQDEYLNERTARACGMRVSAGPIEATAIGNVMVQLIAKGDFTDVADARACVKRSFDVKEYQP